jgi:hypothetical protein
VRVGRYTRTAGPPDIAAFLNARAGRWRPATLGRVLASLARVHRVLGLPDPTKDEEVRAAYPAAVRRSTTSVT